MNDILSFFDQPSLRKAPGLYSFRDSSTRGAKTFHDFVKDGTVILYYGESGEPNYALRFQGQYLPFSEDAEELTHESQIYGVYGYPVEDLNVAFWEQEVDTSKLVPLWKKDTKAVKKIVDSLGEQINALVEKQRRYKSILEGAGIDKSMKLDSTKTR